MMKIHMKKVIRKETDKVKMKSGNASEMVLAELNICQMKNIKFRGQESLQDFWTVK